MKVFHGIYPLATTVQVEVHQTERKLNPLPRYVVMKEYLSQAGCAAFNIQTVVLSLRIKYNLTFNEMLTF